MFYCMQIPIAYNNTVIDADGARLAIQRWNSYPVTLDKLRICKLFLLMDLKSECVL